MSDLDRFMDNARDFADFVGQKAVDAAEMSRQFARRKSIEYKINEKYKELGRLCFETQRDGTDASDAISSLISEIDLLNSELRAAEEESMRGKRHARYAALSTIIQTISAHTAGNSL